MPQNLVIVESPAKAKTLEKFLGKGYAIKASLGHVRDLPRSQFGVDVDNNFAPKYIAIRGKGKVVQELRQAVKKSDRIYLATDPDREGEAIAWHISALLNLPPATTYRITFNEITQKAVQNAINNPRKIDPRLVDAQQARRILDRLVGYLLSPLLWHKVRRGLSAGRVQSVAVRLICEREAEIRSFIPKEYWSITAFCLTGREEQFPAKLITFNGQKIDIRSESEAKSIAGELAGSDYRIQSVKTRERVRNPNAPFTTSSLQQEASRKLGYSAYKTMSIAQKLYEGLEIKDKGHIALVTYIRTDSVRISEEAQAAAANYIRQKFGAGYLPEKPPAYKTKAVAAQEAHEAIRPVDVNLSPEEIKNYVSKEQWHLYKLVWDRFVASQMKAALIDTVSVDIKAGAGVFRAAGSTVKFQGYLAVYEESLDEETKEQEEGDILPPLSEGERLKLKELQPRQHFTQPPPRYTEAMLIKALEENGIGRPSTYAPIIETIRKREYVVYAKKRFEPTELGEIVVNLLKENFSSIVDIDFTAGMEEKLDEVASGKADWVALLSEFYIPFSRTLEEAKNKLQKVVIPDEPSDVVCELCGRRMVYKRGRFGRFLACPGYPQCKNTKPIRRELSVDCPLCGGKIMERRSKKGKIFYGCGQYPKCTFVVWQKPSDYKCEKCGTFCLQKKSGGRQVLECAKPGCGHQVVYEKNADGQDG
ncbi:MAG: type I DNA topoisomerase [Bacillota bacterium]